MKLIRGTRGRDVLTGSDDDERLEGLGGHDALYGGGGDDWIYGGSGDDRLFAGTGNNRLFGEGGNDTLLGGLGRDTMDGGSGRDFVSLDRSTATGAIHFSLADPSFMQTLDNGTTVVNFEHGFLRSGSGNDQLTGGRYDDVFYGGEGEDRLEGGGGHDHLYGDAGNDSLYGGDGEDRLEGGDGDDLLVGGRGDRIIEGGAGSDHANLDFRDNGQFINFLVGNNLTGTVRVGGTEIRGIEQIVFHGGRSHDVIGGGELFDIIYGGSGDDILRGEGGDDWLHGESGHDRIFAGAGADLLHGEGGNDFLKGEGGDDRIEGGGGDDALYGDAGNDNLYGGEGADRLEAGDGDDLIVGGRGDRIIDGGAGNDQARLQFESSRSDLSFSIADNLAGTMQLGGTQVRGFERIVFESGSGDDTIAGGDFFDVLRGGSGDDILRGEGGDDWLYGDGGDDRLFAGAGNNILHGGAGNDTLLGGLGRDTMDGGSGRDFVSLDRSAAIGAIHFSLANPSFMQTVDNGTTVVNFEHGFLRSGSGNDRLIGGRYDDHFHGGEGDDRIEGGGGDDALYGDAGNDNLYGGEGADRLEGGDGDDLLVAGRGDRIIDGGAGSDHANLDFRDNGQFINFLVGNNLTGTVRVGGTEIRGIEQIVFHGGRSHDVVGGGELFDIIYGGSGDDILRGEGGDDWLHGESGHDRFFAGAGTDLLHGEGGNDFLKGEGGDDTINGGDGIDRAVYSGSLADYRIDRMADGSIRVADLRSGGPDGVDIVRNVELFEFVGGVVPVHELPQTPSNHAPEATPDSAVVGEDSGPGRIDVLTNDRDPDTGDRVTIASIDTAGSSGRVTLNPDGSISYSPDEKFEWLQSGRTATDTFRYAIQDLAGVTSTAEVTVTVVGVNDAPRAVGESFAAGKTGATTLGSLLANDSDVDQGDTIALGQVATTSARGATISIDAQGRSVYDPGDIFAGLGAGQTTTDSFIYTVVDSHGAASTATVSLTIGSGGVVLDPTLAIGEPVSEDESIDLYSIVRQRMTGSYGPEAMLVSVDGTGTLGTVSFDPLTQNLTYTAEHPTLETLAGDTQMTTAFTYAVGLASGEFRTGAVTMTVSGVNDNPTAVDDATAVQEGQVIDLWNLVRENDLDPEGDYLHFAETNTAGTLGRVEFDPMESTFRYAADTAELLALGPGETVVDYFTYTIHDVDVQGGRSTATVEVTVTGAGEAIMDFAADAPLPLLQTQMDLLI